MIEAGRVVGEHAVTFGLQLEAGMCLIPKGSQCLTGGREARALLQGGASFAECTMQWLMLTQNGIKRHICSGHIGWEARALF